MASTGKKGKKNKGITFVLADFLADKTAAPAGQTVLIPRKTTSWSDEVEEADNLDNYSRKPLPLYLPTAPRAARAVDLDESRIPKNPPYVAYLSNLSYETEESDISDFFKDLNISNVRLPRDERSGRLKGFGYVEFNDRVSFVSALQIFENTIKGRRIRIEIADNNDGDRRRGQRDNRDRDSNYDSERTSGDWRSGPRSIELSGADDRRGPRRDYGGFKERDGDKGRSYDRDNSSWRDSDRRFQSDRDTRDSRGGFSSRRYDERDRDGGSTGPPLEPKTRPKLQLKPRTLPIEEIVIKEEPLVREKEPEDHSSSDKAASIFGQAKPVDTAAREREIEERLARQNDEPRTDESRGHEEPREREEVRASRRDEPAEADLPRRNEPASEPKENAWHRRTQRESSDSEQQEDKNGRRTPMSDHQVESDGDVPVSPPQNEEEKQSEQDCEDVSNTNDEDGERYARNRVADKNRENEKDGDRYRQDRDRRDDKYNREKRYNERDDRDKRYNSDRDREAREGDSRKYQDRDRDDFGGANKASERGDRKVGGPPRGDKPGPTRERVVREPRKQEDARMPKLKETSAPNYVGTNKFSFLDEDGSGE